MDILEPSQKVQRRVVSGAAAELAQQERGAVLVIIDDTSPPGAWDRELKRAPWAYGQYKPPTIDEVLWLMRKHGLTKEADIVAAELAALRTVINNK